ncbi:MAG: choice-of-anchor D domain-containing protein, partial [Desulfobacteraceae bacterium]|nr:choice-of-anchor D domain-containing protein [Desulfobacteraceae bacterium]
ESFPGGKLIEVAEINGADKIEALTAHPNGFLYAGDGKSWYKIWPDEPDNNMPTWEKELDFSFGTEGMDFWFETEKVKLDDDDFTNPLADEVILFTNSLGSLDDVANQDGKSLDTRTVIKWFGTGQNVGDSYLGLRFHNFPTYDLKVISAKLQITNNRRNQWIDSSASVYAEKSENPGIFSQDTLPSDRVLTSAYGTYDKDERWNLGQVLSIDVTEPMQELVAEGLAGETVALVVKGTGKRWARLLFNYDNLDVVKLVVVVRDTEPDQTEPEINVKQGATDIPAGTGSYDFGGLTLGSLSTATFTIENTGDEVLTVSSADISSDQFYLDNPDAFPLTVEAGSSATFDIAFDATMTGIHAPTVSIGNDDNDENPYTFILQGVVSANGDELAVYEQGNGLFLYVDGSSRKFLSFLSDWNIEKMIRWGDNRVVDFGSNGLFSHDGISWTFLSSWNADDMISWGDYLVVDFGSDGLFLYDGSELIFMSSWDADNMLSWGDTLVADFGSNGLFYYDDAASGIFVSDWNIDNMIAWGNVLVLDCGSNGVFLYDGSEWTFTSGWDADDMIIWRDQLVVDFGDDGVFIYEQGTSWTFTSSWNPENMITWGDELVMDFGNDGVFIYEEGTSWTFTSSWDAKEMMTWGNELVIDFGDKGVFIYEQGTSWTFTSSWIADNVVTWGDELVVDFGNNGLYVYVDGATWVFISSWDVENMQSW